MEIAQSSYNVVQKTLTQISSLIKPPEGVDINGAADSNCEDDWDDSIKNKSFS